MLYHDPYDLFDLPESGPEGLDRAVIKRLKRKILAEFELSGEFEIELRGVKLDKATALGLVSSLENPKEAQFLWRIHHIQPLKDLLEMKRVADPRRLPEPEVWKSNGFLDFVGERLAPVLDRLLTDSIRKGDRSRVIALTNWLPYSPDRHQDQALQGSRRYYLQHIQDIKQGVANPQQLLSGEIEPLRSGVQMEMMNFLPTSSQGLRNRYANALYDLAEFYEEEGEYIKAYQTISTAADLHTDASVTAYVKHLKVQMWLRHRKHLGYQLGGSDPGTGGAGEYRIKPEKKRNLAAIWIVIILFGALGLFSLLRTGRSDKYEKSVLLSQTMSPQLAGPNSFRNAPPYYIFDSLTSGVLPNAYAEVAPDQPYLQVMNQANDTKYPALYPIQFINTSDQDAVVFLVQKVSGNQVSAHRYVPAGKTSQIDPNLEKKCLVYVYTGENWQANAYGYFNMKIGGFTTRAQTIHDPSLVIDCKRRAAGEYENTESGAAFLYSITFDSSQQLSVDAQF